MVEFDVLSYGTIGLDRVLRLPHLPRPDMGVHTDGEETRLGGNASNTASHLAAWGLRVAVSGTTIGDDAVGDEILARLKATPGLDTCYVRRQGKLPSMYCIILVTPDGERAIIGVNANNNPPTPPTPEMISRARLLTLDLYGGEERALAARMACEAGLPVVAGEMRTPNHPALPYTTIAIASAAEIACPPEAFARAAQAAGTRYVIVSDGPRPAQAFDANGQTHRCSPPTIPVDDTTGAGDAFRAGVVYGVLTNALLKEILALGVAAGSLKAAGRNAATTPSELGAVIELAKILQE